MGGVDLSHPEERVTGTLRLFGALKIIAKGIEFVIPKKCFPETRMLRRIILLHSLNISHQKRHPLPGMEMEKNQRTLSDSLL